MISLMIWKLIIIILKLTRIGIYSYHNGEIASIKNTDDAGQLYVFRALNIADVKQ
jgi:hypothetical protein